MKKSPTKTKGLIFRGGVMFPEPTGAVWVWNLSDRRPTFLHKTWHHLWAANQREPTGMTGPGSAVRHDAEGPTLRGGGSRTPLPLPSRGCRKELRGWAEREGKKPKKFETVWSLAHMDGGGGWKLWAAAGQQWVKVTSGKWGCESGGWTPLPSAHFCSRMWDTLWMLRSDLLWRSWWFQGSRRDHVYHSLHRHRNVEKTQMK